MNLNTSKKQTEKMYFCCYWPTSIRSLCSLFINTRVLLDVAVKFIGLLILKWKGWQNNKHVVRWLSADTELIFTGSGGQGCRERVYHSTIIWVLAWVGYNGLAGATTVIRTEERSARYLRQSTGDFGQFHD